MKKSFPISTTFDQIRQLPVEVSYAQVEAWVLKEKLPPQSRNKAWWTWFKDFLS